MTTETFPTWQHVYKATRTLDTTPRKRITVTAGLHHIHGNPRPYFSVTASIDEQAKNGRWINVTAGQCPTEVLAAWPELAPVVKVHLADDTGAPMHSYANARYFLGLTQFREARKLDALASIWQITRAEADEIAAYIDIDPNPDEALRYWHDLAARTVWPENARIAIETLDRLAAAQ